MKLLFFVFSISVLSLDLIDGYADEKSLLEKQIQEKTDAIDHLEQELLCTGNKLQELEAERQQLQEEKELLFRQKDAMKAAAGPIEQRMYFSKNVLWLYCITILYISTNFYRIAGVRRMIMRSGCFLRDMITTLLKPNRTGQVSVCHNQKATLHTWVSVEQTISHVSGN